MNPANFPNNKNRKRKEAEERNTRWAALSHKEQLVALDHRPGKSVKQRAKIKQQIADAKAFTK